MKGRAALALGVLLLAALQAQPALAHSKLVRSSPAARGTVAQAPARVQLWFNERIEPAFAELSVWSKAGARVDSGDLEVDPDDPLAISVGVAPLAPGVYTVRYRVLSVDGHVAEADFTFTVTPAR